MGIEHAYIKIEENKIYWVGKKGEMGSVDMGLILIARSEANKIAQAVIAVLSFFIWVEVSSIMFCRNPAAC